jgi:hypothetical protein
VDRNAIIKGLERLEREHAADADGGDRLVRAVIRYARTLAPAERAALERHLLALVDAHAEGVWPMALETLVRTGNAATGRALIPMLTASDRSPEWSDAVVLAMMRLGCANALGMCRDYVREELRQHHVSALPMLAWLYRTDVGYALPLAARFFAEALALPTITARVRPVGSDQRARIIDGIRRQMGGQLDGLLASSTATVLDLIDQVTALDAEAGRAFAGLLLAHLARPEAPLQYGRRAVDALGDAVRLRRGA